VLRWRTISTDGLPHSTLADDVFKDYRIPRGSIVILNHWTAHMDATTYVDPTEFRPERWIDNPDLPLGVFGYGRRACPGRRLALMSLEAVIPALLWAFEFHGTSNGDAPMQDPGLKIHGDAVKPASFPMQLRPRSQRHQSLVQQEFHEADTDIGALLDRIGRAVE
jgi:cytochrome P450